MDDLSAIRQRVQHLLPSPNQRTVGSLHDVQVLAKAIVDLLDVLHKELVAHETIPQKVHDRPDPDQFP